MASSITLRRELVDAILFKFPGPDDRDDMQWPSESAAEKKAVTKTHSRSRTRPPGKKGLFDEMSEEEDEESSAESDGLRSYWAHVLEKHQNASFIQPEDSTPDIDALPHNWMVISITLTEDKTALLVSRQRPKHSPVVFYVPLKGRREEESEEHFTFDDAMAELRDILQLSQEGTRQASEIKSEDKEAKAAWCAQRKMLDGRMKELLANIEFCWLGGFKVGLRSDPRLPKG